jgi:hypothetical protein
MDAGEVEGLVYHLNKIYYKIVSDRPYSEQTIGNLTRAQLEEIITEIAKKTVKQEMINTNH